MLVLFFLLFPAVFSVAPKCPENFKLFKRTPTAKNNHTKEYCLGIFFFPEMNIRDLARSYCGSMFGASLAVPENSDEYYAVLGTEGARNRTWSRAHAIDGEISPHCKAKLFRGEISWRHNWFEEQGECNMKKNLLIFDDRNTDPTYILSQYTYKSLNNDGYKGGFEGYPKLEFHNIGGCLMLQSDGQLSLEYCNGGVESDGKMNYEFKSVLCGLHPM